MAGVATLQRRAAAAGSQQPCRMVVPRPSFEGSGLDESRRSRADVASRTLAGPMRIAALPDRTVDATVDMARVRVLEHHGGRQTRRTAAREV
jgi:hypothetical protein